MPLPFVKAEGTGNDFVVVDLRAGVQAAAAARVQDPAVVREICDRHFGVGADGVLAILPSAVGDARMRVLNADGSEAEMCGNGLRCVAKVLYESDPALRRPTLNIETGAGVLTCTLDVEAGLVRSVTEEMGRPRLTRGEIPLAPGGPMSARFASRSARATATSASPRSRWATRTPSSSSRAPTICTRWRRRMAPCWRSPTDFPAAPTSSSPACAARRSIWSSGSAAAASPSPAAPAPARPSSRPV